MLTHHRSQIFRFSTSKSESLFLQRKNPRKIAWTQVYRRMHKKGITEEVAKKRSRRTVKHQRGIVGADLASIVAKRNQTAAVRAQARQAAISKAKTEKREKEAKKAERAAAAPPKPAAAAKSAAAEEEELNPNVCPFTFALAALYPHPKRPFHSNCAPSAVSRA